VFVHLLESFCICWVDEVLSYFASVEREADLVEPKHHQDSDVNGLIFIEAKHDESQWVVQNGHGSVH